MTRIKQPLTVLSLDIKKALMLVGTLTTLTACGGGGGSSTEPVVVTPPVTPPSVNSPPVATVGSFSVNEDMSLSASLNGSDADGDNLSFSLGQTSLHGELSIGSDGSFVYTPAADFYGQDSFTFKVNDGKVDSSTATVTVDVTGVNDAPVFNDVVLSSRAQQPLNLSLSGSDIDSDQLSYQLASQPTAGQVELTADGQLTYTPAVGSQGEDSFEITLSDGTDRVTATVMVDNGLAYSGHVIGTDDFAGVEVILTTAELFKIITPDAQGSFKFYGLPDGEFSVKVRKPGYKSEPSRRFVLDINSDELAKRSVNSANKSDSGGVVTPAPGDPDTLEVFTLEELDSSQFSYHWQEDQSTAGYDYSAHVNQPVEVTFLQQPQPVLDDASANQLHHELNIILANDELAWSQEHAYRLNETFKSIPQAQRDPEKKQHLLASKWILTDEFVEDDIEIEETDGNKTVRISTAVFVNASPRVAEVDGRRGLYYSQRLHHALLRYVTDNGENLTAVEKILNERFGISTLVDDYASLTASTTGESGGRFQSFHPQELIQIINMFEEMPKGMHKLPELKYLVRRLDGTPHPLYPDAPAVAWSFLDNGYIEFMASAFDTSNVEHMHRLVIHEKAHFLWENQFDHQLRADWIELGGWFEDASDPDGWSTTKQTEFVSAYAHQKNPNEDMAESISYFIINPDKLKSRALAKYEFIRDRIMQGNIYLSTIRDDLTFQVYNLFPDYVFPGKIKRIDIGVEGAAEQDKEVSIEIELHALDKVMEGAVSAFTRIYSDIGTYVDLHLYPVDADGNRLTVGALGTTLRGSFSLNKHAKNGYWRTDQIVITDAVGNERMEGRNDFGWKLYINNSLEDLLAPQYVTATAQLDKSVEQREGQEVQLITASWQVDENVAMDPHNPCYATLNDELLTTYAVEGSGQFVESSQHCEAVFVMPHYKPSGTYSMNYVRMADGALNQQGVYFTDPDHALREDQVVVDEQPQQIELITNNPDTSQPELDLNDIQIVAEPTNPEAPNGETLVTVTFKVRDDISGYNIASLYLRDPQGINHQFWAYNDGTHSLFPQGDPSLWQTYSRSIVLPVGSAPGTWGLAEMTIHDRAGNFKGYDFTEIVHFDVVD